MGVRVDSTKGAKTSLKADVGLLGVVLDSGEHKVELRYRTPFLSLAMAVSLASCLILAAGIWRWPSFFVSLTR
jgi:uncharacterized membrane protein YfhO